MSEQPDWLGPITDFTTSRRHLPHMEMPDSYYFTTTCTKVRGELASMERDEVLSAILFMDGKKYTLDAAVVMPGHFHLLLHPLQKEHGGYYRLSEIFHSIKSYSAKRIIRLRETLLVPEAKVWWPRDQSHTSAVSDQQNAPEARRSNVLARHTTPPENKIWQDENHDHLIRNEKDYREKLMYILYNAVKNGLASAPFEYPWLYWIGMPGK